MTTIEKDYYQPPHCSGYQEESLLKKYNIPIKHFDFDYIRQTRDANELEKILEVLRSGQEGHYPELSKTAEDQLRILRPGSKCLRRASRVLSKNDLDRDAVMQITQDIQQWVTDISRNSKELQDRKTSVDRCDVQIRQNAPQKEPLNLVKPKERVSCTDYRAWDKYDPDAEMLKQDIQEEKLKKHCNQFSVNSLSSANIKKLKKTVTFNKFSTEAEANFVANRELEKGREFFKTGDYELALHSFTQSIQCKPSILNLNNRALTQLKLQNYREALADCDRVLAMESKNLKALLRKAQAFEGLGQYEEALDSVELVIAIEPNNSLAQELAARVRQHCRNVLKNTRMKIVEIE